MSSTVLLMWFKKKKKRHNKKNHKLPKTYIYKTQGGKKSIIVKVRKKKSNKI